MPIANIISLLGGVALFLFGMSLMGDGLKRVAGNKLELILWKLTNNPLKGILLGTAVTAVIQSSSATTVMVVGFVNSAMMKVSQAIGIIMGANIGTSVTGWILCLSYLDSDANSVSTLLSTATLSAIIALVGIILRMFCKKVTFKHLGNIMLGFSVLMFGMQQMSQAVSPLKEIDSFTNALTAFSNPLLGILIGIVITALLQSASASVGILQALTMTGAISFQTAFPIIMGMGIGAAAPVLLSAIGANTNGKRTAFIYLFNDLFGTIVIALLFYTLNAFIHFDFMTYKMSPVSVAFLNTMFRFSTMLFLSPFIGQLEKLVCFIFKDNPEDLEDTKDIEQLEERFLAHPALAIEQSRLTTISMAKKARKNLFRAISLMYDFDNKRYDKVQRKEDVIDKYEDKLGTYLVKLTAAELRQSQTAEVSLLLHTIGDFERIGDHAVNIAETAREISEKKAKFSNNATNELNVLRQAITDIVDLTINAYIENDIKKALEVEPLEEVIDSICYDLKTRHINRVKSGKCTLSQGFIFNDILADYERVADYCSNIAVAMIELESNSFDTHEYLNSIKTAENNAFKNSYEKYRKMYSI